ncbi:MAG TPA: hypothetical protein IAB18_00395 [Candidatus Avisuccinivibrio pullicola]|nr:hypothetical protein [Candidatus Avisuccinivibrio pullicola]
MQGHLCLTPVVFVSSTQALCTTFTELKDRGILLLAASAATLFTETPPFKKEHSGLQSLLNGRACFRAVSG